VERRTASDDGAAGHLAVEAARQAAGRERDAAADRGIGRALGALWELRTAVRAAGALCGDDGTQDGVIERMHFEAPIEVVKEPPTSHRGDEADAVLLEEVAGGSWDCPRTSLSD
jgi:hypothetical protein